MDIKIFLTVFLAVLVAELGDKTQLATMLFAADKEVSKWTVFWAASAALVVASALGVLAGTFLSEFISERWRYQECYHAPKQDFSVHAFSSRFFVNGF